MADKFTTPEYDDIMLGYGLACEAEFSDADYAKAAAVLYYGGFISDGGIDWDSGAARFIKELIDQQDEQMLKELEIQGRAFRSYKREVGDAEE